MGEQGRLLGSLEVADYYVRQGLAAGIDDLTNMKLNKLVYIAHGWHLGYYGKPLVRDALQPWGWGPVFPELYYWIKFMLKSEGKPLDTPVYRTDFFHDEQIDVGPWKELLDRVCEKYVHLSACMLEELTHKDESPWDKASRNGWIELPDYVIQEYYEKRLRRRFPKSERRG